MRYWVRALTAFCLNWFMTDDSIWVTRPEPGVHETCRAINAAGLEALAVPTLEITAPPDPAAVAARAATDLARARVAVFVSRNAVDWLWQLAGDAIVNDLAQCDVVAVGPGTAAALESRQVTAAVPAGGADSEALLQLPALHENTVTGKHVAIIRGIGGRELLADTLQRRGAHIHYIEVYARQQNADTARRLPILWREHKPAAIVVTSPAGLEALIAMTPAESAPDLMATRLFCLGRRLPEHARAQGFRYCIPVSATDGDRAIVDALHTELARRAND